MNFFLNLLKNVCTAVQIFARRVCNGEIKEKKKWKKKERKSMFLKKAYVFIGFIKEARTRILLQIKNQIFSSKKQFLIGN